jgi:hypothetical protein
VLRHAVRCTLIYSDLFEYPLSAAEVHRYLIGVSAPAEAVLESLRAEAAEGFLEERDGVYFLAGRDAVLTTRQQRTAVARRRWPQARRYGGLIARLPFVRMVAVTGSLAMDNADLDEDIDYLIVTEPGRLWLTRALVIAVVRLAAAVSRVTLCPNYLVTLRHPELGPSDFFSAHEFAQMRPLAGAAAFRLVLRHNSWVAGYLPNAFVPLVADAQGIPDAQPGQARADIEGILGGRRADRLEAWERDRKTARLLRRAEREGGRVAFTADECRGHFGGHELRIAAAYRERLARYGVAVPATLDIESGKQEAGSGN